MEAQRLGTGWLKPDILTQAYRHLVLSPEAFDQIGPAVNSGKSFLIYGQPGNGKTTIAEALVNLKTSAVYVPHAIEYNGTITQIFDPLCHRPMEGQNESASLFCVQRPYDSRWVRCCRPFIVTGGELSLEMLELSYNSSTKVYSSPCHLKANNGIYLIDDFGRQKITPAELLNRWIVPMESRVDHMTLPTGGKMSVPFEAFLIFSTNLDPDSLGDEAFLRRIQYKMFVRNPDLADFIEIFRRICRQSHLEWDQSVIEEFIETHYVRTGKPLRRCHPRDIVSHAVDLIQFRGREFQLTKDILDNAFASCFAETSGGANSNQPAAAIPAATSTLRNLNSHLGAAELKTN